MLPQDEERIKTQIAEAEALIEREVDEFYARHPKEADQDTAKEEKTESTSKATVGEPRAESPSVSNVDTTNPPAQEPQSGKITAENQAVEEHNGEVVVENEEDTVIY